MFDYGYGIEEEFFGGPSFGDETIYETFSGVTDAAGDHFLRLDFDAITAPRPFSVMAEAMVMDVIPAGMDGRHNAAGPSVRSVRGIRSQRTFVVALAAIWENPDIFVK